MRRTVMTALALAVFTAGLWLGSPSAHASSPESCTHNDYTALGHAVVGDQWRATFHVKRPCLVELWTFTASGPSWPRNNPQHLSAHRSYRLTTAGTYTRTVALPPCYFQADATVNGRVVDTQTGGTRPCQPSTTTTSPPPSTTSTSSTPRTSTTTSTRPTPTSTPTTAPALSPPPAPPSSITSSPLPACEAASMTSEAGSPTDTACELPHTGSSGLLGVIGIGVIGGGSLAYLGGRRRRRRFEAELEAMKP